MKDLLPPADTPTCQPIPPGTPGTRAAALSAEVNKLTSQEVCIVVGLATSNTVKGIALETGLSEKTIEWHRAKIYRKLGLADVAGLTRWAIRTGLVRP